MKFDRALATQVSMLTCRSLHVGRAVCWLEEPSSKWNEFTLDSSQIFLVFNFWAGMFCVFNFAILVASLALASKVDVQKAVMAGMYVSLAQDILTSSSGFFGVFTLGAMLPTHLYLILVGRSTIESFQSRDQSASELAALRHEFHIKFFATKEMRETVKLWENEFGGVVPNDRWKWGTPWLRWKDEMGSNPLGWICESYASERC